MTTQLYVIKKHVTSDHVTYKLADAFVLADKHYCVLALQPIGRTAEQVLVMPETYPGHLYFCEEGGALRQIEGAEARRVEDEYAARCFGAACRQDDTLSPELLRAAYERVLRRRASGLQ